MVLEKIHINSLLKAPKILVEIHTVDKTRMLLVSNLTRKLTSDADLCFGQTSCVPLGITLYA